jgi:hypothetical protein
MGHPELGSWREVLCRKIWLRDEKSLYARLSPLPMSVQKDKPKNVPRSLETAAQERDARIRLTIATSERSVARSKELVKLSKELVAELRQMKKDLH